MGDGQDQRDHAARSRLEGTLLTAVQSVTQMLSSHKELIDLKVNQVQKDIADIKGEQIRTRELVEKSYVTRETLHSELKVIVSKIEVLEAKGAPWHDFVKLTVTGLVAAILAWFLKGALG